MGRIKVGQIEGSKEDVVALFKEGGVDMADYINPSKKVKVPLYLIVGGLILLLLLLCVMTILGDEYPRVKIILSLVSTALAFVNVALIHLNWKNWGISAIAVIGELVVFSLAHGVYTEKDIIEKAGTYIEKGI